MDKADIVTSKANIESTKIERNVLTMMNHPFIVSLHGAFQTSTKLYLLMDYVSGGELFHHIHKQGIFLEHHARVYVGEIVLALEHLHAHGVIHRDLKPENILLGADGHVILTDFGLSKMGVKDAHDAHHKTLCGTNEYMAPEMINGTGYGRSVDWWALGTLVYEMLTGDPPFSNRNTEKLFHHIKTKRITLPSFLTKECHSLIKGLLDRNVDKRLGCSKHGTFTVGGVRALKDHPFFEELDWVALARKEVEPPFRLEFSNSMDVHYFDSTFTSERITRQHAKELLQSNPMGPALSGDGGEPVTPGPFGGFSWVSSELEQTMEMERLRRIVDGNDDDDDPRATTPELTEEEQQKLAEKARRRAAWEAREKAKREEEEAAAATAAAAAAAVAAAASPLAPAAGAGTEGAGAVQRDGAAGAAGAASAAAAAGAAISVAAASSAAARTQPARPAKHVHWLNGDDDSRNTAAEAREVWTPGTAVVLTATAAAAPAAGVQPQSAGPARPPPMHASQAKYRPPQPKVGAAAPAPAPVVMLHRSGAGAGGGAWGRNPISPTTAPPGNTVGSAGAGAGPAAAAAAAAAATAAGSSGGRWGAPPTVAAAAAATSQRAPHQRQPQPQPRPVSQLQTQPRIVPGAVGAWGPSPTTPATTTAAPAAPAASAARLPGPAAPAASVAAEWPGLGAPAQAAAAVAPVTTRSAHDPVAPAAPSRWRLTAAADQPTTFHASSTASTTAESSSPATSAWAGRVATRATTITPNRAGCVTNTTTNNFAPGAAATATRQPGRTPRGPAPGAATAGVAGAAAAAAAAGAAHSAPASRPVRAAAPAPAPAPGAWARVAAAKTR
jgi:serine/threonine protein kinase